MYGHGREKRQKIESQIFLRHWLNSWKSVCIKDVGEHRTKWKLPASFLNPFTESMRRLSPCNCCSSSCWLKSLLSQHRYGCLLLMEEQMVDFFIGLWLLSAKAKVFFSDNGWIGLSGSELFGIAQSFLLLHNFGYHARYQNQKLTLEGKPTDSLVVYCSHSRWSVKAVELSTAIFNWVKSWSWSVQSIPE